MPTVTVFHNLQTVALIRIIAPPLHQARDIPFRFRHPAPGTGKEEHMVLTVEQAQTCLEEGFAPWVKALNLTVEEISADHAVLSMPITDQLARMGGIVSGQALAAMADTSMVIACLGSFGEMRPIATTNLDTQFLRPGTGECIRCDARIVRAGKALMFCQATMIALPMDKPIATATATFYCP